MRYKTFPSYVVIGFFVLGMLASTAFRAIMVANHFDPSLARGLWYFAVIGYIFFFGYRFIVSKRRRTVIIKNNLIQELEKDQLTPYHKKQICFILRSIVNSKEIFNYVYIFVLSILAIVVDLVLSM